MITGSIRISRIIVIALAFMLAFTCMCFVAPSEAEAASNKDFVIFIAPGHTPNPNFTRGGISEGQLNEQLSIAIGNALRSAGYTVYLTNKLKWEKTDLPVILTEKAEGAQYSFANQLLPAIQTPEKYGVNKQCDLVLSVHHNAAYDANGNDSTASGIKFFYNSDYSEGSINYGRTYDSANASKIAAEAMTKTAKSQVQYSKVKDVTDIKGTGVNNSICRFSTMSSVLIEAGFMTNATELAQIRQQSNMKVLANSIVTAVSNCKEQIRVERIGTGSVTIPGTKAGDKVTIDGVDYTVGSNGSIADVRNAKIACVYTMHSTNDKYTTYPTGLKVYRLTYSNGKYTAKQINSFDNVLQYAGTSIRIKGKQGIRVISGIPTSAKNSLTSSGLSGYTLEEDGLIVAWADNLGSKSLTFATCDARGRAYVRGSKNPVYSKSNGVTYYTNTLTFTDMAKTKPDLVMRSYMILKDSAGKEYIVYGGPITRSIYYIAKANKDTYKSGTDAYKYIWNIINYNEGKNPIMSKSGVTEATKNQMMNYFIANAKNKNGGAISSENGVSDLSRDAQGFPNYYKTVGVASLSDFVDIYIQEAKAEGVRPDVAFAQMINETGYLGFGRKVRISDFNFAGIGAVDGGTTGNKFSNVREGIRAQIQHLKAYASKDALKNACVDPRFNYVERGSAPNIEQLSRKWASNEEYGEEIISIINGFLKSSNDAPAPLAAAKAMLSRSLMMMPPAEEDVAAEPAEIVPNDEKTEEEENVSEDQNETVEPTDTEGDTGEKKDDGDPSADDQSLNENQTDDGQEKVTDESPEPQTDDSTDDGN